MRLARLLSHPRSAAHRSLPGHSRAAAARRAAGSRPERPAARALAAEAGGGDPARPWSLYDEPALYESLFGLAGNRDLEEEVGYLSSLLPRGRPARCLEVGCGPAWHSVALARQGHACTALDASPAMLRHAAAAAAREGARLSFVQGSMLELPALEERQDLVFALCGTFLELLSLDQARAFLEQMPRVLAPGGRLLLHLPHPQALFDGSFLAGDTWESRPSTKGDEVVIMEFGSQDDLIDPETQVLRRTLRLLRPPEGNHDQFAEGAIEEAEEVTVLRETVVSQRAYTVPELRWLAAATQLQVEGLYGGFGGEPLDDPDAHTLLAVLTPLPNGPA